MGGSCYGSVKGYLAWHTAALLGQLRGRGAESLGMPCHGRGGGDPSAKLDSATQCIENERTCLSCKRQSLPPFLPPRAVLFCSTVGGFPCSLSVCLCTKHQVRGAEACPVPGERGRRISFSCKRAVMCPVQPESCNPHRRWDCLTSDGQGLPILTLLHIAPLLFI